MKQKKRALTSRCVVRTARLSVRSVKKHSRTAQNPLFSFPVWISQRAHRFKIARQPGNVEFDALFFEKRDLLFKTHVSF